MDQKATSVNIGPRSYADQAVVLQMPLIRLLGRRISWADREQVWLAIQGTEEAAKSMDDEIARERAHDMSENSAPDREG